MKVSITTIAFGGVAFEPQDDEGRDWCLDMIASFGEDYNFFRSPDACMIDFDDDAFCVEPHDARFFFEELQNAQAEGI